MSSLPITNTTSPAQKLGIYDKTVSNEIITDRIIQHIKPAYSWVFVRSFPYDFDDNGNLKDARVITVGPTRLEGLCHFIRNLFLNTHAVNMNRAANVILGSKDPTDKTSLQNAAQQNYRITLYVSYDENSLNIHPERVQAFPGAECTQSLCAWFFSMIINPFSQTNSENPSCPLVPPVSTQSPIRFTEEVTQTPQPLLLSRSTKAHPILDYKTNAVDFSVLQFREKNPDWSLKSRNWYERLPLTLKLRILHGIQEGHSPRNETSGPLCEAIRSHIIKVAPTQQSNLIAKEITRLENLQKKSPLLPMLIAAEEIYSLFKKALSAVGVDKIPYGFVLQSIYDLAKRVQKENPTAFLSLQKIASAAGIHLQIPTQEPQVDIDPTTQFLIFRFIEVLALWIDNEGSTPGEEKPKNSP